MKGHGVPGVELLAIGESSHVVVAHEVAAAHRARTLIRHEAALDLKLRAHTQARHGRRLPGHPKQQQEQRPGPPAPGPERHRTAWTGARRGVRLGAPQQRCKRGKVSRLAPGRSARPPPSRVRPQPGRGEEPRPGAGGSSSREFLCPPRGQKLGEDRCARSDRQARAPEPCRSQETFGASNVAADPVSPCCYGKGRKLESFLKT